MSKGNRTINEDEKGFRFSIAEDDGRNVMIEVSEEDYERERAQGIPEDELLKPGRHRFRRGGFLERHGLKPEDGNSPKIKVRISIHIDSDILSYFRQRAEHPNAVPYETQINDELRRVMERDGRQSSNTDFSQLIESEEFIAAVAERVKERRTKVSTRK